MSRSISVAMITRDEAAHLDECLACIEPIADEICIVDTGSQDKTLDIARRHGARVELVKWQDDFAASRNASLKLCAGDWILVIDPDERIAQGDLGEIRALAEGPLDRGVRFVTRNYTNALTTSEFHACAANNPDARGFQGWHPSVKVRLFPNRPGIQFEGVVHELVERSLERLDLSLVLCQVPIHHYPLEKSAEKTRAKNELYIRLGRKRIHARPTDAKAHADLGNHYTEAADYANAAACYRESLRLEPANPIVLKDLGGVLHLLNHTEEAIKSLTLALKIDPAIPEAWRNLGVIQAQREAWPEALECFEQGMVLDPAWPDGYRYLSIALEGVGRLVEAADAARKAVETNPNSAEALELYAGQMGRLDRRGAARVFLKTLVDKGWGARALLAVLDKL